MRKAQRWNNETSSGRFLNSMLEGWVRDLFSGPDRPKYRHSGAVRPATKPRRQSFALEAIEPRLLMSDTPVQRLSGGSADCRPARSVDLGRHPR